MKYQFSAMAVACTMAFAGSALASTYTGPVTGTPSPNPSFGDRGSNFPAGSTNALNFAEEVPGRVGQVAPYVLFEAWNDIGTVTLSFWNEAASGIAFFEYRLDGGQTGTNSHAVITGDTVHQGVFLANGDANIERTFTANEFVEIRLALGGERDWDFDWTRFDVAPSPNGTGVIPLPAAGWLLLSGLAGLGVIARRKRAAA